jgi:hypothetical protein
MMEDFEHMVRHEGREFQVDVGTENGGGDRFTREDATSRVRENDSEVGKSPRRHHKERWQGEGNSGAGVADRDHPILEDRLEPEIAAWRDWVKSLILRLELGRSKPEHLSTAANLVLELRDVDERVEASAAGETIRMAEDGAADLIVRGSIVLDYREWDDDGSIDAERIHVA